MAVFLDLLACPACGGTLTAHFACNACARVYEAPDGIPDLRIDEGISTRTVRRFYEEAPFPGYPPRDSLSALRARAERSDFMRRLDAEIPPDARIVEIGCGTGQTSLFLARGERIVIGADLTHASLVLGAKAKRRFGLDRVMFVGTDLRQPGLRKKAFDVVYSSGVLHHTKDPRGGFRAIAELARPGGLIVVGLYNFFARIPLRVRRITARATNYRFIPFDPVLRDRANEPERRRAWLRDQYQHPEEHTHTLREVQEWFAENDIAYLRAYPSALLGEDEAALLEPAGDNWRLEGWLAQLAWIRTLGYEGGLFVVIGQRLPSATAFPT
jgi:SAM-dependent methyltransferase